MTTDDVKFYESEIEKNETQITALSIMRETDIEEGDDVDDIDEEIAWCQGAIKKYQTKIKELET